MKIIHLAFLSLLFSCQNQNQTTPPQDVKIDEQAIKTSIINLLYDEMKKYAKVPGMSEIPGFDDMKVDEINLKKVKPLTQMDVEKLTVLRCQERIKNTEDVLANIDKYTTTPQIIEEQKTELENNKLSIKRHESLSNAADSKKTVGYDVVYSAVVTVAGKQKTVDSIPVQLDDKFRIMEIECK